MHLKTDTSSNAHFARVPTVHKDRNTFSIAEKRVTTAQFDLLHPVWLKEIMPGDSLNIDFQVTARLQTQISILFDDLMFDLHAWYVPNRLLWDKWSRFQFNEQPAGPSQDNTSLVNPYLAPADGSPTIVFGAKTIYDDMLLPTGVSFVGADKKINSFPFLMYNFVWNTNYRDENLQNPVYFDPTLDSHKYDNFALLKRGRRHDRFTSALPFQQKGTAPSIPLGISAWVKGIGKSNQTFASTNQNVFESGAGTDTYAFAAQIGQATADQSFFVEGNAATGAYPLIYADLLNGIIGGPNTNTLRNTISIQHLLEADARGGTRDVEAIQHRWGVTVPDARLQRPEYIGGITFDFDGIVVPQSSETATTPQGTLVQFSQARDSLRIDHAFQEHGFFMILLSARSNITYQQGLDKFWSRTTRYDYYQPEFANIGEVALYNEEIFFQSNLTTNRLPFGYQEYGYELRYGLNAISREMRSNYATSLDNMVLADDYATLPTLGSTWIQSNTDISRNIAVSTSVADPIHLSMMAKGSITRVMPMYSVPGLLRL